MLQNQRACQLVRSKTGCEPLALARRAAVPPGCWEP